jgi:hypothetical protein
LLPPQKLQRLEIFPACVACLCADAAIFHHPKEKNFFFARKLAKVFALGR